METSRNSTSSLDFNLREEKMQDESPKISGDSGLSAEQREPAPIMFSRTESMHIRNHHVVERKQPEGCWENFLELFSFYDEEKQMYEEAPYLIHHQSSFRKVWDSCTMVSGNEIIPQPPAAVVPRILSFSPRLIKQAAP